MPIFKLSAPKTVRLLSGHNYFAQKWIKFHPQPSRFPKKFPGRNPRTLAYRDGEGNGRGWERIKGLIPLKEVQRNRTGEGRYGWEGKRRGRGSGRGESCSKDLRGDRRPCCNGCAVGQAASEKTSVAVWRWHACWQMTRVSGWRCFLLSAASRRLQQERHTWYIA